MTAFGLGPKRLDPASPSWARNTRRMIAPTSGTKAMRSHQPLRPVSWSLRTVTESEGISNASVKMPVNMPIPDARSKDPVATSTMAQTA